jgi:hypothetical protein
MTTIASPFSALTEHDQALLLASFSHELTMVAREGYEAGTEHLSDPQLLRRINEIQHRVASAIMARLSDSMQRYPDDVLVSIIAGSDTDAFSRRLHSAFRRAWRMAFDAELPDDFPQ